MPTMSTVLNHSEAFHYDVNDYLQKYYNIQLTKSSIVEDNNLSAKVKVVRPKSTRMSAKCSSVKSQDELLASYTTSHIYSKDRLAQTSAKVAAFCITDVRSSAQIEAAVDCTEFKKMVIPTTEITPSFDYTQSAINCGKNKLSTRDKTYDKHTSSKKNLKNFLPMINTINKQKTSEIKWARGSLNGFSIQKSHTDNLLPKM